MDVGCGAVKQTDALQERVTASPGGGPRASRDEAGQHPQTPNHGFANVCLFTPGCMQL